jgi:Zn-dependent protease
MGVKAINTLQEIWNGFDFGNLLDILLRVVPALVCITLHELSHGMVAYALGDDTAKNAGRLTLNPIKHLDPMGLLMMVIFGFGYAKPVPVNSLSFKNPKRGMALTALAGPGSNLIIGIVFLFLYGLFYRPLFASGTGSYVLQMLYITAYLSFAMGIFNLIPIPPLDGSKILFAVLPEEAYWKLMRYERYGFIVLIAVLYFDILDGPLMWLLTTLIQGLWPVFELGLRLGFQLF